MQEYQEIDQEYAEAKSGKEFDGLTEEIMGSFNKESRKSGGKKIVSGIAYPTM